ncbi:MAG TPA: hypothetical protein VGM44_07065, partial [Polyangiaceae bacterium]
SDRPPSADVAARLLSGFFDEQRAIDELRQNVLDACPGALLREPSTGAGGSCARAHSGRTPESSKP